MDRRSGRGILPSRERLESICLGSRSSVVELSARTVNSAESTRSGVSLRIAESPVLSGIRARRAAGARP